LNKSISCFDPIHPPLEAQSLFHPHLYPDTNNNKLALLNAHNYNHQRSNISSGEKGNGRKNSNTLKFNIGSIFNNNNKTNNYDSPLDAVANGTIAGAVVASADSLFKVVKDL
jgi:hypothetical protein